MEYALTILSLIGGLALFLYGMELMGGSLKKLAGGKLESILARLTSNRFFGFLLGLGVTAIIQSSSATTVMLVGFVNSGIMKLGQTISVILGADIGTTVTAWLLSTSEIKASTGFLKLFTPDAFTPLLALMGLLLVMAGKSDKKKNTGTILLGFAILMFGMDMMSGAMGIFKESEAFQSILTMFQNPLMGILVGTIFTAVIQSSSASIGVLQALSISCPITYATAIPVILGQNIGTTITPIISSVSGNIHAKRVAMSCLYIKMIGVIVISGGFYLLDSIFDFGFMTQTLGPVGIAVIHTLFNVLLTVILLPFCSLIEKLAVKTVRSKKAEKEIDVFATLDDRFLSMPSFAVEKCKELVDKMSEIAADSYNKAASLVERFDPAVFAEVVELETLIDKYEDKTSTYLVKIAENDISAQDSKAVTELLHCIGDIERISDHALNIAEAAKEISDKKISFSKQASADLAIMFSAVSEILSITNKALKKEDVNIAFSVEPLEQVIDRIKRKIKNGHIDRLKQGDCTIELGFILSDLLTNCERISDHCSNIAVCIIEIYHDSFEVHEYLHQLKSGEDHEFAKLYKEFKQKYYIS